MLWLLILLIWLLMTAQASSLSDVSVLKTWKDEAWASSPSTIISPDTRFAVTRGDDGVYVRDIDRDVVVFSVTMANPNSICVSYGFSKQTEWFFVVCDNNLMVWDWKTKKKIIDYFGPKETNSVYSNTAYFASDFSEYLIYFYHCGKTQCQIIRLNQKGQAKIIKLYASFTLFKITQDRAILFHEKRNTFAILNLDLPEPRLIIFKGHTSGVSDIAIDLNRNEAISQTESTKIWDLNTGREMASLVDPDEPKGLSHPRAFQVAISPNSKWLLTIAQKETKVWDLNTRKLQKVLQNSVLPLFTQHGQVMIHAEGGDVVYTQIGSFVELLRLKSHLLRAYPRAASSDGTRLVSTSTDQTLKVWNPKERKLLRTLGVYAGSIVNDFGTVIGLARGDGIMHFYEIKSGRLLSRVLIGSEYGEKHLKLSPDGRYFAFGELSYYPGFFSPPTLNRTRVRVWDTKTGRHLWTNFLELPQNMIFRSDGQKLVVFGKNDSQKYTFVEFDTLTGKTNQLSLPKRTYPFNENFLLREFKKQWTILLLEVDRDSRPGFSYQRGFVYNLTTQKQVRPVEQADLCFSSNNTRGYLRCQQQIDYAQDGQPISEDTSNFEQSPSGRFFGFVGGVVLVQPFKNGLKIVGQLNLQKPRNQNSIDYLNPRFDRAYPMVNQFSSNGLYFFTHSASGIYMLGSRTGRAIF